MFPQAWRNSQTIYHFAVHTIIWCFFAYSVSLTKSFDSSVCSGLWHLQSVLTSPMYWQYLISFGTAAIVSIWMTKLVTQCCRCCWPPLTTMPCSPLPQPLEVWKESSLLPFPYQRVFPGIAWSRGRELKPSIMGLVCWWWASNCNCYPLLRKQLRNAATRTFHDPNAIYSELILWRVDHIGPLSCTGGVSELARINSLHTSAFSNVAWLPTLVPSTVLGKYTVHFYIKLIFELLLLLVVVVVA